MKHLRKTRLQSSKEKLSSRCAEQSASSHTSAFPNSQSRAPHPQCTDTALSLPGCWEHGARGLGREHFKLAGTAGICTALIFLSNNSVPPVGGRGQGAQQQGCLLPRTHRASPSLGQRGYLESLARLTASSWREGSRKGGRLLFLFIFSH